MSKQIEHINDLLWKIPYDPEKWIEYCGPRGAGKTIALIKRALKLIHAGDNVIFITCSTDEANRVGRIIIDNIPLVLKTQIRIFSPENTEGFHRRILGLDLSSYHFINDGFSLPRRDWDNVFKTVAWSTDIDCPRCRGPLRKGPTIDFLECKCCATGKLFCKKSQNWKSVSDLFFELWVNLPLK